MSVDEHIKNLSINLDKEGQKIIASFTPEGEADAITLEDIRQAIHSAGFGGYNILQPSLEEATSKYNSGEAFEIIVGEALDGKFSIRIDANLMAVYLSCTLPRGGTPVQLQNIQQEVGKQGITVALDLDAIDKTLREGGNNILIAKGRPPVEGVDGRIESTIPAMKEKTPHLDEHGLADFRDLGEIVTVHEGEVLMRLILPTNGDPGETVTGKPFPVKQGKSVAFSTNLDGAILDPNDPTRLVAAISGCPVIVKDGVTVDPVFNVQDVDLHTGNINFSGAVHVSGDVQGDMTIIASGDIYVDGTVGNAMLESGGDIIVKGGIIGGSELHADRGEKFHASVKCKGSCTARFVQNANITAGNAIYIHDISMLSTLTAGHQIIVGDKGSRKGDIIGGKIHATMLVKAQNIGSPAYLTTVVSAGADNLLHERLDANTETREAAVHELGNIIKLLEIARLSPGRIPPETVKTLGTTRDALNAQIAHLREEEVELRNEMDIANRAQIVVEKHLFGGAEISIGLMHQHVTKDKEGGVFHLSNGELVFV